MALGALPSLAQLSIISTPSSVWTLAFLFPGPPRGQPATPGGVLIPTR